MSDSATVATLNISPNDLNREMEPPPPPPQRQDSNRTDDPPVIEDNNNFHIPSNHDQVQITTKSAAATAAADSDRTNSSSITSTSSNNNNNDNHNNDNNGNDNNNNNEDDATNEKSVSTSHVSFGSVHVHEHRMTLGTNPGVSYGVPVELAWSAETSDMFDSIEEFERRAHAGSSSSSPPQQHHTENTTNDGTTVTTATTPVTASSSATYPHTVHRLRASDRDEIASRHHSRDSIVRVKKEVQMMQEQRHDSKKDKEAINMIKEIRRQRMEGTLTLDDTTKGTSTDRENDKAKNTGTEKKSFWSMCCP
jgi:hypothetical protein